VFVASRLRAARDAGGSAVSGGWVLLLLLLLEEAVRTSESRTPQYGRADS